MTYQRGVRKKFWKARLNLASKNGGTRLQSRVKGNRLWCSFHKDYHTKQSFCRMGKGWQGWCRLAMRENVKRWKAEFRKRTGEIYG